jgi:hypothetical protein
MAVEILSLVKAPGFQTASQRNRHFARVWDIWTNNPVRTLLEELEVLEVTDFVWGFLCCEVFEGADFPSICSPFTPKTIPHASKDRSGQLVNEELDCLALPEGAIARNNLQQDGSWPENNATPGFRLHASDFIQSLSE